MTPYVLIETDCVTNGPEATLALFGLSPSGNKHTEAIKPDGQPFRMIEQAEIEANAKLMAAAPDLLEACKKIAADPYTTCQCAEVVRAAIAKAEGA